MKKLSKVFSIEFFIGIILTLLAVTAFYFSWSPIEGLEYRVYDLTMNMKKRTSSVPVAVIAIDDESIANIGRWPWPRSYIAQMVDILQTYEPRVIGINILYSEEDINQGLKEVREILKTMEAEGLTRHKAYTLLQESEKRLDNDAILSSIISENKRVVLPLYLTISPTPPREEPKMPDYLLKNSIPLSGPPNFLIARDITPPIASFASYALGLGHINIVPNTDGTVRSEPLLINYANRLFPSFALQLALKYLNYDVKDIVVSQNIAIRNIRIPTYEKNTMLISFNKKLEFSIYSFIDVLANKVPPNAFKNKIVILSPSATGLGSTLATPIGPHVPNWFAITTVISNILNNDYIIRPLWAFYAELGIIILFGIFLSLLLPRLHAGISALISLCLLVVWSGVAIFFLTSFGYWLKLIYPGLLLLIGYTVIVSQEYLFTQRVKEHIEADSIETNKMLGLSFQGQGMLDIAFEKFRKCPVEDESVKDLLYNLALDFERKRMFNKAVAVYEHIAQAGSFKDIEEKIHKLKAVGETAIFGLVGTKKDATVLVESAQTKPTLGRYEILKELGKGAMGTVYLGKDPKINREVAIKTLRYEEFDPQQVEELKKRFFREAEAAGKLSHPNIVTIYDIGEDYDIAYMAMELLDGTDLAEFCEKDKLLPPAEVIRIISSVAGALDYAHSNGVVHRDIKPANIMLLKNGEIKVADFGIARVMASSKTHTGVILGTPSYMSPEQIAGQKVDGRSDLFSLGVVFYELLTGSKPFEGDSIATLMYNITTSPPPPLREKAPTIPVVCESIINRLLSKDKEERYQTGRELMNDLAECLKNL